jgi:hypothetical protein
MTDDFWIPIDFSEDTNVRLYNAVMACHLVHTYTLENLNSYFLFHAENYLLQNFRKELVIFLKERKENLPAQYYSLVRAAEKTFPYFSENKKFNKKGKFLDVKPIPSVDYKDIQIETRLVWRKYLALNNLITTTYGSIHLDEKNWSDIVAEQAAGKGIDFDAVPFYWHSIVVRVDGDNSTLRFNLHEPYSKFGKRAKKEMKAHAKEGT